MPPKHRVIIDTDPGVDDVLAILLALASSAEEIEVVLFSMTFGNIDVRSCLRNVIAIFHILEKELAWRKQHGRTIGFESLSTFKPIIAIGADGPLQDQVENADYFHGKDGLAGIHTSHPHLSPEESWKHLFDKPPPDSIISKTASHGEALTTSKHAFKPSMEPSHKEILRILKENEPDTITIVSIGPLTNCALAAAADPETFLRVKEVVSMGGAIDETGNVTPVAEFNVFADAYAAASVYALTSPDPTSTMPPTTTDPDSPRFILYPPNLTRQLKFTLMSLDITSAHVATRSLFDQKVAPLAKQGSPLAEWMMAFMTPMFDKMERLRQGREGETAALEMHDPMCVWYLLTHNHPGWKTHIVDVRVETAGQWTKGMTVGDKRPRKRRNSDGERPYDKGNWLGGNSGNRVRKVVGSPGVDVLGPYLIERIFGSSQTD